MTTYPVTRPVRRDDLIDRVVIDGRDVTHFRGGHIPTPGYTLTTPFGYGSSDPIRVPKVNGYYETYGVGDLHWIRKGAKVQYQRCERLPDGTAGEVVATDYLGEVWYIGDEASVPVLTVEGDLLGTASYAWRPPPLRWITRDGGTWLFNAIERELGKRYYPRSSDGEHLGVQTGIDLVDHGGMYYDDFIREVTGLLQHKNGNTWTVMPTDWGGDEYTVRLVDRETIAMTFYVDKVNVIANLVDGPVDSEWFGQCITPDGEVIRNAKVPNATPGRVPNYPIAGDEPFGVGTTNADTVNGSGITVLHNKLIAKYLMADVHQGDTYTLFTAEAVRRLRKKLNMAPGGTMNLELWEALWDVSRTGFSLSQARIHPILQDPRISPWLYTENGSLRRANPKHDPSVQRVSRPNDFGPGYTMAEMVDWFEGEQERLSGPNYTGQLTIKAGAAGFLGTHNLGDPIPSAADVVFGRDVRPDTNLWLPNYKGGLRVYAANVTIAKGGDATVDVDTHNRSGMEVREIIARNKEAKSSPIRLRRREMRRSKGQFDARRVWEGIYGWIWEEWDCPELTWRVIPILAGQMGQIEQMVIVTDQAPAAWCMAVFAKAPNGNPEALERELERRAPDPWAVDDNDETVWEKDPDLEDWFTDRVVRGIWGNEKQPCGYGRRKKTNKNDEVTDAPITGRHRTAGFSYVTFDEPVLYLAMHADRDTVVQPGHAMWKAYEDTA